MNKIAAFKSLFSGLLDVLDQYGEPDSPDFKRSNLDAIEATRPFCIRLDDVAKEASQRSQNCQEPQPEQQIIAVLSGTEVDSDDSDEVTTEVENNIAKKATQADHIDVPSVAEPEEPCINQPTAAPPNSPEPQPAESDSQLMEEKGDSMQNGVLLQLVNDSGIVAMADEKPTSSYGLMEVQSEQSPHKQSQSQEQVQSQLVEEQKLFLDTLECVENVPISGQLSHHQQNIPRIVILSDVTGNNVAELLATFAESEIPVSEVQEICAVDDSNDNNGSGCSDCEEMEVEPAEEPVVLNVKAVPNRGHKRLSEKRGTKRSKHRKRHHARYSRGNRSAKKSKKSVRVRKGHKRSRHLAKAKRKSGKKVSVVAKVKDQSADNQPVEGIHHDKGRDGKHEIRRVSGDTRKYRKNAKESGSDDQSANSSNTTDSSGNSSSDDSDGESTSETSSSSNSSSDSESTESSESSGASSSDDEVDNVKNDR